MARFLYSQWAETRDRFGSETALTQGNEHISFNDLDHRVHALTQKIPLRPRELKNRVVMFSFPNSADWMTAFLLCQKFEAIALPVEGDLPEFALDSIRQKTNPVLMLSKKGIFPFTRAKSYRTACLIKLTSGSSGHPKPFVFTDHQMVADGHNVCTTMGIDRPDINYGLVPFSHSYGMGNLVIPFISRGIPIVISSDYFPHAVAADIATHKPTVFPAVPPVLRALLSAEVGPEQLKSIRLVISAGSPLKPELSQKFYSLYNRTIHNFYGSSETGGIAYDKSGECSLSGNGVGTPMDNVIVHINRRSSIVVCSDAVYTRYNKQRSHGKGLHIMPDSGFFDSHGKLHLLKRNSRLAKIAGRRVDLREIENLLLEYPEVSQAFVSLVETPSEPRMAAVVESRTSKTELSNYICTHLPKWKCPHYWIITSKFPLNSRGKPDRDTLDQWINKRFSK